MQQQLEERTAELETLRKKMNREQTVNGSDSKSPIAASPSKQDLNAAREEIKGLKYVDCFHTHISTEPLRFQTYYSGAAARKHEGGTAQ